MNLRECYEAFGGDYNDVLTRLMDEDFVKMFVVKFLNDKTFDNLVADIEKKDIKEAFREAHTLKGLVQNLSFTSLFEPVSVLTDELRDKESFDETSGVDEMLNKVKEQYDITVKAIKELD